MYKTISLSIAGLLALAACQPAAEKPAERAVVVDNTPLQLNVGIDAPPPIPADNP